MCESFFVISKGPYLLGLNLAIGCIVFRWVTSSQTFCPSSKGLYLVALIVIHWACIIACCTACLMALVWVSLKLIAGTREWVFLMCAYGTCPIISSNGDLPIVALGQALWVYCASGSHLAQSVCAPFLNIQRYCSSHWLVLSDWPSVCGWYTVLMFCLMSKFLQSSCMAVVVNRGSRSNMTFWGSISKFTIIFCAFGHFSLLFCWHASTQACTSCKVENQTNIRYTIYFQIM